MFPIRSKQNKDASMHLLSELFNSFFNELFAVVEKVAIASQC